MIIDADVHTRPTRTLELALIFSILAALPKEIRSKAVHEVYRTAEHHRDCEASQQAAFAAAAVTLALEERS